MWMINMWMVLYWMVMFLCFSITLSSLKCCNYGIGLPSVTWRGSWELTDLLPSFVAIRLFVGLIVFTPGTPLNIYVLLIPVISEHWIDLSAAGWLLLLIFGMGSQLIWFYRERLVGGALYWKMCSVVCVLDLFSCMYMYEVITVKKWWLWVSYN